MRLFRNYWNFVGKFFLKFNYQIPTTFGLLLVYKDYKKIYKYTSKFTNK